MGTNWSIGREWEHGWSWGRYLNACLCPSLSYSCCHRYDHKGSACVTRWQSNPMAVLEIAWSMEQIGERGGWRKSFCGLDEEFLWSSSWSLIPTAGYWCDPINNLDEVKIYDAPPNSKLVHHTPYLNRYTAKLALFFREKFLFCHRGKIEIIFLPTMWVQLKGEQKRRQMMFCFAQLHVEHGGGDDKPRARRLKFNCNLFTNCEPRGR